MFSISLFRSASTTGHVFTYSGGRAVSRGAGWSGLIGPATTIAVVPTTVQVVNYAAEAYTNDRQQIKVVGSVQVTFDPPVARDAFDFTVSRQAGGYVSQWHNELQSAIVEQTREPIRRAAGDLTIDQAVVSLAAFERALQAHLSRADAPLLKRGIRVESCSVAQVAPSSGDIQKAIGAKEREALLTGADAAVAARRQAASAKERELKSYEEATKLLLETERAKLVDQQGQNQIATAKAEAEATSLRLEAMEKLDPGHLLGAAFLMASEKGSLTDVTLTTDLLALLKSQTKEA